MNISNIEYFLSLDAIPKSDEEHVAKKKMEAFINNHIARINKKGFPSFITFTAIDLIKYLEKLMSSHDFMTWETYGVLWNIDHILEVANVRTIDDAIKASVIHNFYPSYVSTNTKGNQSGNDKYRKIIKEEKRLNELLNPPAEILENQPIMKLAQRLTTLGYPCTAVSLGILLARLNVPRKRTNRYNYVQLDVPTWLRLRSLL